MRRRFLNNINKSISGDNHSEYFTIEALEDGLTAKLSLNACEYRIDDSSWYTLSTGSNTPSINTGQTLSFKGNLTPTSNSGIGTFTISKKCNLKGNIMSMLYGDDFIDKTDLTDKNYAFCRLFNSCITIVDVSELLLPAKSLAKHCYYHMFTQCTSLTTAPDLPATKLADWCYAYMFNNCKSLVTAPILPATTLANYCYYHMFYGCTSLTTAPALPATKLVNGCYHYMFQDCTSLTTAPTLPATTLAPYCYSYMFYNCSSLTNAPALPAITLVNNCYAYMLYGCTSLTKAPKLPATNLARYCYENMFEGCASLTTAPELPATTLAERCYSGMFGGCTSLTTAPKLLATKLADYCYASMFSGCSSLTTAPSLPAITLARSCYFYMFEGCASLTTAPELLATTLAYGCYYYMFQNCTSLVTAPELPATTLAERCYYGMFINCISLTTAPTLPATTLADYCYYYMFQNCSKLNNIVMSATDISATNCLINWVGGVASIGTFVKHYNMTSLSTGSSGIPNGWEVKDYITPTECTRLTITADDVIGNKTTTIIHYTAICNGIDYKGNIVTEFVTEGTAVSVEFPQNTSETETVERTITFEFMGITSSTVIIQGVWVNQSYTVDLNNQWQLSTTISNPDNVLYDGVYQSFSNKGVNNSAALMYIDIVGYTSFKFYVRSYAESSYDFVVVSNLDGTLTNGTTNGTSVKLTTSGKQNSGTDINSYQLVEFTGIDSEEHRITVMYRKDSSSASGDDRGYVLIPKNQ